MNALEIKGLVRRFGDITAVDNIDIAVSEGEIYGLLGPNGAGKSTIINLVCGLLRPNVGSIKVFNKDISKHSEFAKTNIGIVPQDVAIYNDLTAYENVSFFAGLYGIKGADLHRNTLEALEFTGLSEYAKRFPKSFSGGMKRRLNIACAIAHKPPTPKQISALYFSEDDFPLGEAFIRDFLPQSSKMDLILSEEKDIEKAKAEVQNGKTACYIHLHDEKITVYAREGSLNASLIDTIMKGFSKTFDAYAAVAVVNPSGLRLLNQTNSDSVFTNDVSLDRNRTPKAMDYYAVTILTMIIMYGSLYGTYGITAEREHKTLYRMFIAPVKSWEILVSKAFGNILGTLIQAILVLFLDIFLLKTYWGEDLWSIIAIITAQVIMMISVGLGFGHIFKHSRTADTFLSTIIPFLVFLGGGYVNLDMVGITGFLSTLTHISPVRWVNKSILQIIYAKDYSTFAPTIALCLSMAVIFLGLSAILSRKEQKA